MTATRGCGEIARLAGEMVELGIARDIEQAYSMINEAGLSRIKELVKRKRRVEELVRKFLEEGLPYRDLPVVSDVEDNRDR